MRTAARHAFCALLVLLAWRIEGVAEHRSGGPGSPDGRPLPRMPIAVFTSLNLTDSLVRRIFEEAEAIWRPAGLTFDWYRATETRGVQKSWLDVTIEDVPGDPYERQQALGWIPFTSKGPLPSIHLLRSNAERQLAGTPGLWDRTTSSHETLLGRALGRALSHELGHYLLRSRVHTSHGLMRAVRSSEEFFGTIRGGFELRGEERDIAILRVAQEAGAGDFAS